MFLIKNKDLISTRFTYRCTGKVTPCICFFLTLSHRMSYWIISVKKEKFVMDFKFI